MTNLSLSTVNSGLHTNTSISAVGAADYSITIGAVAGTFLICLLVLLLVVAAFCYRLKKRNTKFSIEFQRSKPHNYCSPFTPADVEAVETIDNVAYCTVKIANILKSNPEP